jgi:threonyl-tRNA synthetase
MIKITLPDGNFKEIPHAISGIEFASLISLSLAKAAIAIEVNGELSDLSVILDKNCTVKIITAKDPEGLEILRHDTAHILAQAVKELYPACQITIGPAIEHGFYYDISYKTPFQEEDLAKIEAKMKEVMKRGDPFIKEIWERDTAVEYFKSIGEDYKAEIIASIPANEKISLYRQGNFLDLCRGPHAPSTAFPKAFKLMKLAGAYWRGDAKNEMLQRIYGTAWASEKDLQNHLHMLAEAEKRDHRKLGKELGLFHMQEEAPGQVFWHDKGYTLYKIVENYIRRKIRADGYIEVKTPFLADIALWQKSGHAEKYLENMFLIKDEHKLMALKPMNCPLHIELFNQSLKSYRDLPIRMSEFGCCHRNESSGSMHGIMRTYGFTQDDAHIFCTPEQITEETIKFTKLLMDVYKAFGFDEVEIKLSTRPEKRAGRDQVWDLAETSLRSAISATGHNFSELPGEGAFYGPKLEFHLKDAIGRTWQCGTFQLDFVLPERLEANYIGADGAKHRPVILHRAILGSMERFLGILIEQHAGHFPLWLAPIQAVICPITNEVDEYAIQIFEQLKKIDARVEIDLSPDKINYKIRKHSLAKIPLIIVVGKNEAASSTISLRRLGSEVVESISLTMLNGLFQSHEI